MPVIIAFAACVLIWGSTWYAIEFQLGTVAKEWSVAYRFALAAVLLQAWCMLRGKKAAFGSRGHIAAAGTGIFLFSINYLLVYAGTEHLTSGLVAIAFSTLSLMNIMSARVFLRTPIHLPVVGAAVVGVGGLAMVFGHEIAQFSWADETLVGLAFCMAATVTASLGNTIAASETAKQIPILPFTAAALFYGSGFNIMIALASGQPMVFDTGIGYSASLLYLSVFGTVIAFTLYLWLIAEIGIARAGYISVVMPLVALSISTIYEGFVWSAASLVGLSLIIFGNALIIRLKDNNEATPKVSTQVS